MEQLTIGTQVKEVKTGIIGVIVDKDPSCIYCIGVEWEDDEGSTWWYQKEDLGKKIQVISML